MTLFQESSDFTIEGGNFSAVAGSQHIHNYIKGNLLQLEHPRKESRQVIAQDQYRQLRTGDIQLKRKLAETKVKRWDLDGWRNWGSLEAHRIIYAASVRGEGRGEDNEFLYIRYQGRDAVQAYQQDFKTFSAVKDVNWVELFGYIAYNELPALVFYDAHVPLSHILERNGLSSMLYTYLCYSGLTQGLDTLTLFCELWVNPRNGTFHKGPYVDDSSYVKYSIASWSTLALPSSDHPFLDLQSYNNTNLLFQYLIRILPIHEITKGISWSNRATPEWLNNQDAKLILTNLPGAIYHRTSRQIIARYPGDREKWYYHPWKDQFLIPKAVRETMRLMDDGSMRFMFDPVDIASLEWFVLNYVSGPRGVWNSFADSWVSQGYGIFSQLGIEEREWGEYSVLRRFHLQFERVRGEEGLDVPSDIPTMPVYLFIRPAPHPFDDENEWDAWLGGRSYYWSFDSATEEEISEGEQRRFGLPSFKTTTQVWHNWWDRSAYDAMRMVNSHKGFDPASVDLARSLGDTILEVVDCNARLEEVPVRDDDDEVEDVSIVQPRNGGSENVGFVTPRLDARSRKSPFKFTKPWIQRLKGKITRSYGR